MRAKRAHGHANDRRETWHVPGHSPLSGDYTGHDQIGGFFQRTMELSGGAFNIDVHNVLAEDDLVVVLVTVNAERNGLSASFPEIHVWRMKNGKATDFREYQSDEQRENRFWVLRCRHIFQTKCRSWINRVILPVCL